jgi:hypothetical protein
MRKIHFVVLSAYSVLKLITRLARADLTAWILIAASASILQRSPLLQRPTNGHQFGKQSPGAIYLRQVMQRQRR